jgi:hypothetical protein
MLFVDGNPRDSFACSRSGNWNGWSHDDDCIG